MIYCGSSQNLRQLRMTVVASQNPTASRRALQRTVTAPFWVGKPRKEGCLWQQIPRTSLLSDLCSSASDLCWCRYGRVQQRRREQHSILICTHRSVSLLSSNVYNYRHSVWSCLYRYINYLNKEEWYRSVFFALSRWHSVKPWAFLRPLTLGTNACVNVK